MVGNDVVLRASWNVSHGAHGRLSRLNLARGDGLQRKNSSGGDNDGIDSCMRRRAVATFAEDGDANRVGVSVTVPGGDRNFPRPEPVAGGQRQGYIGLGQKG